VDSSPGAANLNSTYNLSSGEFSNHGHVITNAETVEACGILTVHTNYSALKENPVTHNTTYEQVWVEILISGSLYVVINLSICK
jgi:hypothetical protein